MDSMVGEDVVDDRRGHWPSHRSTGAEGGGGDGGVGVLHFV